MTLLQHLGRLQRPVQGGANGDDRQVAALPAHRRLPLGHLVVALRHPAGVELLADVVEPLAFEEDHRVGAGQRRVEHPLGVIRRGGKHHLQSGDVGDQGGPVLGVLGAVL